MRKLAMAAVLVLGLARGAHAGSIDVDFNPKAEFARYKTWAWLPDLDKAQRGILTDATMKERVQHALTVHLRERGLDPAPAGTTPDLYVGYRGDVGSGKDIASSIGGYRTLDNPARTTIHFTEQTATVMVDLVDVSSNALAWRLYVDQTIKGPMDPPDKLNKALAKGFAQYPPSASAIARKAKQNAAK